MNTDIRFNQKFLNITYIIENMGIEKILWKLKLENPKRRILANCTTTLKTHTNETQTQEILLITFIIHYFVNDIYHFFSWTRNGFL